MERKIPGTFHYNVKQEKLRRQSLLADTFRRITTGPLHSRVKCSISGENILVSREEASPQIPYWSLRCGCQIEWVELHTALQHIRATECTDRDQFLEDWIANRRKVLGYTGEPVPLLIIQFDDKKSFRSSSMTESISSSPSPSSSCLPQSSPEVEVAEVL